MPKFKIESTTNLIKPLVDLGIKNLFSSSASLPFLGNDTSVYISKAEQQASIDVNEEGTIAISLTTLNVVALTVHIPVPKVKFVVDRPFLAIIANRQSNIPYVIAKVTNPKY